MFLKYNIWGIIWILLIMIACSLPGESLPSKPFFDFDKLIHLFFYGALQILLLRGLRLQHRFKVLRTNYILITFIFSSLYGILIELMQKYVFRNRGLEINDMIANVIGVLLGTLIWHLLFRKKIDARIQKAS